MTWGATGQVFADPPEMQPWDSVHLVGPDGRICDFHSAPVPAFVMEARSLRLLEVNEAFLQRLDTNAKAVVGRRLTELQPQDDQHDVLSFCRRVPVNRDVSCAIRLCTAGYQVLGMRMDCRQTLYRDRQAVLGLLLEDRLLSEQQRRLRDLRRRAQMLFRQMPCVALALDDMLVIRDANAEAARVLAAAPGTRLVGRSLLECLPPARARGVEAALMGLSPGRSLRMNLALGPDPALPGEAMDCELICFENARGSSGYYLLTRDRRTEREALDRLRNAEIGYTEIIASSLDAILIMDRNGAVQHANSEASRLLGYSMGELRRMTRDRLFDEDDPRYREALDQRDASGLFHGRLSVRRVDGTVFEAEVRSTLFRGPSKELLTSTIIRDLTGSLREDEGRDLLNRLLRKVVRQADADSIQVSLTEYLSLHVDYASFCLYRRDTASGMLRAFCWRGLEPALVRALDAVPATADWNPVAHCAATGQAMMIDSLRRSREWARLNHTARLFRLEKMQILPVVQPNHRVDGVLVLHLNDHEHGLEADSLAVESLMNVIPLVFRACSQARSD